MSQIGKLGCMLILGDIMGWVIYFAVSSIAHFVFGIDTLNSFWNMILSLVLTVLFVLAYIFLVISVHVEKIPGEWRYGSFYPYHEDVSEKGINMNKAEAIERFGTDVVDMARDM